MKRIMALALFVLSGCDDYSAGQGSWDRASRTHQCSPEEMERVQREAKWCSDHTGYLSTYCYGSAIMRICKPKPREGT